MAENTYEYDNGVCSDNEYYNIVTIYHYKNVFVILSVRDQICRPDGDNYESPEMSAGL